jgi:tRNA-uridine 2-sulfurtransferase
VTSAADDISQEGAAVEVAGRIAVAMSGGLDSSVVAWLLAREGRPVVGLSMLLWDRSGEEVHGRCCGALDLGDARRVAQQAGIPHYTLRMDREFREKVVDPFVADYLAGRTPSPCVRCNTWIKFDLLLERARAFGAERLATGHYARILEGPEGPELHTALDSDKDQSYYLFELTAEQLAATEFPLGERTKPEVRRLAEQAGLVVAGKGESMEVCFVAGGVREFVESEAAAAPERFGGVGAASLERPATLVDTAGAELGEGDPYYRYTVGQRRGLGLASSRRLYVLAVEPEQNRVVVGGEEQLLAPGLAGERLHWIGPPPRELSDGAIGGGGEVEATVKIRSRHPGVAARIRPLGLPQERRAEVRFAEPQRGIAPGQAAVFYRGSRVLGGCWITGPLPAE